MQFDLIPLGILVLTKFFLLTNEQPTNRTNKNGNKYNKIGRLNLKKSNPDEAIQLDIELKTSDNDDIDTVHVNDKSESLEPLQDSRISTSSLDSLPRLEYLFGIDLKTGAYVVSALGMVHVFFSGCTLFMQRSYMLITIWILITIYSALSGALFFTLVQNNMLILNIYIWYALVFVALMFVMMTCVGLVLCANAEHHKLCFIFAGFLWYVLTLYFVLAVNSYRMELTDKPRGVTAIPPVPVEKTKILRIDHRGNQENLNEKESEQNGNKKDDQVESPNENLIRKPVENPAETPVETKAENPQTHGVTPARRADIAPS